VPAFFLPYPVLQNDWPRILFNLTASGSSDRKLRPFQERDVSSRFRVSHPFGPMKGSRTSPQSVRNAANFLIILATVKDSEEVGFYSTFLQERVPFVTHQQAHRGFTSPWFYTVLHPYSTPLFVLLIWSCYSPSVFLFRYNSAVLLTYTCYSQSISSSGTFTKHFLFRHIHKALPP